MSAPSGAKVPAGQVPQAPAPTRVLLVPPLHSAHCALPKDSAVLPGAQGAHESSAEPSAEELVPGAQARQLAALVPPAVVRKLPRGQGCGPAPPPVQKKPGGQAVPLTLVAPAGAQAAPRGAVHAVQMALVVAPTAVEDVPTGQGTHAAALAAPDWARKVPAGQRVQAKGEAAPGSAEYEPALQFVQAALLARAKAPAGHCLQTALLLAPRTALALPASQLWHCAALARPGLAPKVPAGQG